MKLPTIYKTTATGKIQEWTIEVVKNKYRTITGQVDGKKITNAWTVCEGKNLGRANETTPSQQAMSEAMSSRKKKLEKDYMETLITAGGSDFLQPMLAKKFEDYAEALVYPVYIQPKLDGIRCENTVDGLVSRNGKAILSCPHIHVPTPRILPDYQMIQAFDGELYNHLLKEDFNKITSLVKKTKPSAEDLAESERMVEQWIYDIIVPNMKFSDRYALLKEIFESYYLPDWVLVPTYVCNDRAELDKFYEQFLEEGYEGAIVRIDEEYENKRSNFLLKRKEFQDEEFPVIDIVEGIGNRAGTAGYIVTHNKEDKPFKSNIKGNRAFVTEILKNKKNYIGKSATIKFFRYTPDGIPRFPFVIKFSREEYE